MSAISITALATFATAVGIFYLLRRVASIEKQLDGVQNALLELAKYSEQQTACLRELSDREDLHVDLQAVIERLDESHSTLREIEFHLDKPQDHPPTESWKPSGDSGT